MRYLVTEEQIQALTIRVLSGDLRGVIEGVKRHIEGLRAVQVPDWATHFANKVAWETESGDVVCSKWNTQEIPK